MNFSDGLASVHIYYITSRIQDFSSAGKASSEISSSLLYSDIFLFVLNISKKTFLKGDRLDLLERNNVECAPLIVITVRFFK